jgi:hypothetical protein
MYIRNFRNYLNISFDMVFKQKHMPKLYFKSSFSADFIRRNQYFTPNGVLLKVTNNY